VPGVTIWYATSVLGPDRMNDPSWASRPEATTIHAKRIGTGFSACGKDTATWHKHWSPFEPGISRNLCQECVAMVSSTRTASVSTTDPL
jgi:hypothetical protein